MKSTTVHDGTASAAIRYTLTDQAPVTPPKMPASTTGEPKKKAVKPAKPRKVEKRQRGRKG